MPSDGRRVSGETEREDWDALLDDDATASDAPAADRDDANSRSTGRLAGVRRRVGRLFSVRYFLLAAVAALAGLLVGGLVPLVGGVTRFVGLAAATFLLGAGFGRRAYLEVALASGLATVAALLVGVLSAGFFPLAADFLARHGVAFALGAGALGVAVGALGYYFGRDLRAGFTRSL
ncbi:hypothetical protein GCM10009037_08170 [Halarchaeum grantii]|uniref:Uncharacterized protein n=1 Tax=Halarchaeum grantii TaxID=1193105 RepID=A0A830F0A9_9EURY|nr:hypothetical protein [Halarchaeum grantii]GGL26899.1 hypothetical protein GCM10009037_08170 [Halarchaeum grantii]